MVCSASIPPQYLPERRERQFGAGSRKTLAEGFVRWTGEVGAGKCPTQAKERLEWATRLYKKRKDGPAPGTG
jgi:hypothetical protein